VIANFYQFQPDAGRADEIVPYRPGDGAGAYPYVPPSRYAVAGDRGLVDAEQRYQAVADAGEPAAFTMLKDIFWRVIGVTSQAVNVAGLKTLYEPGTDPQPTPDSGGMIAYGPSMREARPGSHARFSRPTLNTANNLNLVTRFMSGGWHGVSGASEPVRVEPSRHYGRQRPMGVWGRVTTWPKAVPFFRPFNKG
jgi:hypothetical protein